MTDTDPCMTIDEVARWLRVDRRQVLKWIRAGVLPAHRFGRLWRLVRRDVAAFVAANRFQVESTDKHL